MLPDLVVVERQPHLHARACGWDQPTLVTQAGPDADDAPPLHSAVTWLHAPPGADALPNGGLWRAAKVLGRTTLAIMAAAVCCLMLVGVVVNLLWVTP